MGNQYLSTGNDSLNLTGYQLIHLGSTYKDALVILNGKLLEVGYQWRSSIDCCDEDFTVE